MGRPADSSEFVRDRDLYSLGDDIRPPHSFQPRPRQSVRSEARSETSVPVPSGVRFLEARRMKACSQPPSSPDSVLNVFGCAQGCGQM